MTDISSQLKVQRYPDRSPGKTGMKGGVSSHQSVSERMPGERSQKEPSLASTIPQRGDARRFAALGLHREASSTFISCTRLKSRYPPCVLFCQ
jgi:hypothetical protein